MSCARAVSHSWFIGATITDKLMLGPSWSRDSVNTCSTRARTRLWHQRKICPTLPSEFHPRLCSSCECGRSFRLACVLTIRISRLPVADYFECKRRCCVVQTTASHERLSSVITRYPVFCICVIPLTCANLGNVLQSQRD